MSTACVSSAGNGGSVPAKFKLAALLAFLVAVSLVPPAGLILSALFLFAPWRVFRRALVVIPFSVALALAAWWSTGFAAAATLLLRSYTSALAVALFADRTPVAAWTAALYDWHVPETLILTLQFLHRYLTVLGDEAHRMRVAARSRGGFRFDAAAGALGILFARAWQRADSVHQAMLARGFQGRFL
ncbi:MAG: energy-coupling factor transporter transmembrane component T [Acidobacteriota bacterium]